MVEKARIQIYVVFAAAFGPLPDEPAVVRPGCPIVQTDGTDDGAVVDGVDFRRICLKEHERAFLYASYEGLRYPVVEVGELRFGIQKPVKTQNEVEVAEIGGVVGVPVEGFYRIVFPLVAVERADLRGEYPLYTDAHEHQVRFSKFGMFKSGLPEAHARHHVGAEQPFAVEDSVPRIEVPHGEFRINPFLDGSRQAPLHGDVAFVPASGLAGAPPVRYEPHARREEHNADRPAEEFPAPILLEVVQDVFYH